MKIIIDTDLCQGHSVCVEEAVEVFSVEERGDDYPMVKLLDESPDPSLYAKVRAAAKYCPNKVITLIEDN